MEDGWIGVIHVDQVCGRQAVCDESLTFTHCHSVTISQTSTSCIKW